MRWTERKQRHIPDAGAPLAPFPGPVEHGAVWVDGNGQHRQLRREDHGDNVDDEEEEVQLQVANAVLVLESESRMWQLMKNILVAAEPVAGEKEDTHDDTRKRRQRASTPRRLAAAAIAIVIIVSAITAAVLASTASKQPPTATTSHFSVNPAPQIPTQHPTLSTISSSEQMGRLDAFVRFF
jgi:hypothetical protein